MIGKYLTSFIVVLVLSIDTLFLLYILPNILSSKQDHVALAGFGILGLLILLNLFSIPKLVSRLLIKD